MRDALHCRIVVRDTASGQLGSITVTNRSSVENAEFVTARIREIGLQRILYGSDRAFGGNARRQESWSAHRAKLALTEAEFKIIADNVAPYMR